MEYKGPVFVITDNHENNKALAVVNDKDALRQYIAENLLPHIKPDDIVLDDKSKSVLIRSKNHTETTRYTFKEVDYYT